MIFDSIRPTSAMSIASAVLLLLPLAESNFDNPNIIESSVFGGSCGSFNMTSP